MMKVSLQMFSVRNTLAANPSEAMRKVAAIGYHNWETYAFDSSSPYNYGLALPLNEAQTLLKELDVTVMGTHLSQADLLPENRDEFKRNLDYQAAIGCLYPVLAAIFIPDLDGLLRYCDYMNEAGELCRERGMRFHFHNHWHEFQIMKDEKYILDIIMENTDPSLVGLEIDTYWVTRAGLDPVDIMHRYGDRLNLLHQKDIKAEAADRLNFFANRDRHDIVHDMELYREILRPNQGDFCEIGTGIMDIQRIIDAGNELGVQYISLEQDRTDFGELESIEISLKNFHKYTGLDWEGRE